MITRPLVVKYIGNFRPQYSTENDYLDAFGDLGHHVEPCQEDDPNLADHWSDGRSLGDLLLYTRTWGLQPEWFDKLLARYRAAKIPTAAVHLDLFHGIGREHLITEDPMFRCEHVFTADGGHPIEWFGVNHHWLPPAVSRRAAMPIWGDWHSRENDVVFVGSYKRYHEEWPWRRQMIDLAADTLGSNFHLVAPELRKGEAMRGPERAALYQSGATFLTDSLMLGPRYWSDRIPETLGYGGYALLPDIPELKMFRGPLFTPGDPGSFLRAIREAQDTPPSKRREIAAANRGFVLQHDTYTERAQTMLETVGLS